MSLEKYKNNYLELIKRKDIPDHKTYEYLYALELDMINWDDLPPDFDEKFDIPHKMDYGVDLVDLDYTKSCQVKKYEGSMITWSHLSKFRTYSSDVLEIDDMILATTTSAKIDKLGQKKLIDKNKMTLLRNDYDDLLNKYLKIKPKKEKVKKPKIEEREYLVDCDDIIWKSKKNKLKFQLPCGTGKTYIMLYTIQEELNEDKNLKFIIFVPWLDLAKQTLELFRLFKINTQFIGDGQTMIENDDYNVIICVNTKFCCNFKRL